MEEQHSFPFLRETLLFLVMAGVLIPLLQRWRINQVLGFLAAGVALGPYGLGLWVDRWPELAWFTFPQLKGVEALAELGVLFLMFMIGLELSAERLWALRRWVFGGGGVQVALSAGVIGALALAFGNTWQAALVMGLVLSLSSTAVVMQLLSQRQALATPMGQASFSVLMLQDLAVVPLLILIGLLGAGAPEGGMGRVVAITLLKSVGAVLLIFLVGRQLIRPVFRHLAGRRQPDVFMALTLLSTMGIAGLTAAAGLSMALGALLAGLLLAETEYRHEVEVTVEPFKGLLMGLFFMSVGMGIDVREVMRNPLWVPLSVAGLIAIKAAVVMGVFRVGGLSWGRSLEAGLLLGQGGEFAFIVVGVATASGLFTPPLGQFILLVVGLSLFVTPVLARWGSIWGDRIDARWSAATTQAMPEDVGVPPGHVVIAGFGRVGQLMGEVLARQGVPFIAVEHDAHAVARMRSGGAPVFYGDASRVEMLHRLHVDRAAAVVITMDSPQAALRAVKAVRANYPVLPLVARSHDEAHARELLAAGASAVIPETQEAGLQMSAFVLQSLGVLDAAVLQIIEQERALRVVQLHQG
ncbi:MAG TPA: cation:proton antiporter [Aquabacterium sp.]|uniref:cation:proton antiporter domain-containing protein n=1 Tax=Aquabacterium sp. TaxID=1872578 RepID=UPI002E3454EE|nr:cation:proton antiporter [Aquabacterium sp.]HEX5372793.1 cation:proton antiporter [Aquabacterium sp.]